MSSALRVFAVTLCALAALILICGVLLTAALFSADDSLTGSPRLFGRAFLSEWKDVTVVKELSESERGKLTAGDEICYMSEVTPYNRMECELCFGTVEAVDSEFEGEALTYRVTGSDGSSKLLPALFILGVTSGGPLHGFASVFNFGRLPAILLTLSIIACTCGLCLFQKSRYAR